MAKKAAEDKQATPEVVKVELAADNPSGTHTVYLKEARVEFVNGAAEVTTEVADELRQHGIIK